MGLLPGLVIPSPLRVIPAKAGTQGRNLGGNLLIIWVPAFAGMTRGEGSYRRCRKVNLTKTRAYVITRSESTECLSDVARYNIVDTYV
jgi:hypothetical protein